DDPEIKENNIDVSEIEISTYHAFCRKILLENSASTGLAMKGGIMDRSVFLAWGVQNIDEFGFDDHVVMVNNEFEIIENMIDGISVFNQQLISPDDLEKYVEDKLAGTLQIADEAEQDYVHQLKNLVRVYKKYVAFKKEIDVMDYDDLIIQFNNLVSTNSKVRESLQNKFKHILIDEFQDNNFAQFQIVKKISRDGNVTAVGDADQNIYTFQGAYRGIFEDFKVSYPDFHEIALETNYRNPPNVTNLANELLSQDAGRAGKVIVSDKDDDTLVNVTSCASESSQIDYINQEIENQMNQNPSYKFKDFAIFTRKQEQGMQISQRLLARGVPIKYVGNAKIRGSKGAQVALAFLKIISDPTNSMISIVRILQYYGISEQNVARISKEAVGRAREKKENDEMFNVLQDLNVTNLTQQTELKEITDTINDLIKTSHDNLPSGILYEIIRRRTDLYKKLSNDESLQNFVERSVLRDMIENAYDLEKINPDAKIKDFLNFQTMLTTFDVETNRDTLNSDAIQVSTIHKSKGLQFKVVFLADIAARKVPMKFTRDDYYIPSDLSRGIAPQAEPKVEHQNEERRVLYVGMTRAIDTLYITYPTQYENNSNANKASPFLQKLMPSNNVATRSRPRNESVNFALFDGGRANEENPIDRVDAIKNEYVDEAIKNIQNGHYQSAIQRIVDLGKIEHYKQNKPVNGFVSQDFIDYQEDDSVDSKLDGATEPPLGYEQKKMSYSRFEVYDQCPKKFWYKHVLNILPENQKSPTLYKGNFFHKIVDDSAKRKMNGQHDTLEQLKKIAKSKWNPREYIGYSEQRENQDRKTVEEIVEEYHKWDKQNPNTIVGAEIDMDIKIGKYIIDGKIDRVEKDPDGEYVIVDYKTGGKNKEITNLNESLQLNIYAMGLKAKKKFGKLPKLISYFYPEKEGQQIFSYEVNQTDIDNTKRKLEEFLKSIDDGEFGADPNMKKCGWCDYKDLCDESQA
ncbi:MAG: ATP-dependent helicase, partial [Deltaproteobacteria bacterium]|nr:ATP-dependent helicase [Deltaproteobacteria bacterium]